MTPRGTPYNVPGRDDVLQLQLIEPAQNPRLRQALLSAGFEDRSDRARYQLLRARISLAELGELDEAAVETAVAWAKDLFGQVQEDPMLNS